MIRKAVAGGALIAMTLLTVVPGRAAIGPGTGEARISYVGVVEGSITGCAACETPAGGITPTGWFYVDPVGRSFTLEIDDFGTQDGAGVWVSVGGNGLDFDGCIPVRATRTFTGQSAGTKVLVGVHTTVGAMNDCPATTGVVSLTGVA